MNLDLSEDEAAALTHDIAERDRYPFSPRIRTLRAILAKLRPEPVREPLPPPKVYAPPRATTARRHRIDPEETQRTAGRFSRFPQNFMMSEIFTDARLRDATCAYPRRRRAQSESFAVLFTAPAEGRVLFREVARKRSETVDEIG
jgi:hypothetical protein